VPDENAASLAPAISDFFDTHDPVLISAGQLEPEYDLLLQIEALSKIRTKLASAGLLLLGSGTVERELREEIEALNCQEHVMLAGDVPHNATIAAIRRSDLMLRTTLYDGDAISVREALQVGTPVIATDNAMRPSGVTLVPKSDLPALVRAIEMQLARPKNRAVGSQTDEANLQAVFDFYQELLAGN
jgi:glycosyltransferase involved in cell wall biosynthesis